MFLDPPSTVATSRYTNLATFDTTAGQSSYPLGYAFNQPIAPNHLVDQSFYSCAPDLDSFALLGGDIASNRFLAAPGVSSLTAAYVSDNGPWASLSPDFSNPGPSVSGLTAAFVSDDGPWTSPSPDFSNRHAPQATVNHSFCPIPNSYNSTSSPYTANSHTAYSSREMEGVAETSQPILDDGTNLTAPSANTGRQRVMKPRPVCKTCRKSFSRPSDLDRHAKKHQPGAKIHTCSVPGCDYEGSYRKDKLTAHVKNCHK